MFGTGQWNHNRFRVWGRRNDTGLGLPFLATVERDGGICVFSSKV